MTASIYEPVMSVEGRLIASIEMRVKGEARGE